MVEGKGDVNQKIIQRLHGVLRPFMLRRLKKDVEKQLPGKFEHTVVCRLSKRQRQLYEDFMSASSTQDTLKGGNYMGLMNVLMQLRKVCNHPDLFADRPIVSPFFQWPALVYQPPSLAVNVLRTDPMERVDLSFLNLQLCAHSSDPLSALSSWDSQEIAALQTPHGVIMESANANVPQPPASSSAAAGSSLNTLSSTAAFSSFWAEHGNKLKAWRTDRYAQHAYVNAFRCSQRPVFSRDLLRLLTMTFPIRDAYERAGDRRNLGEYPQSLLDMIRLPAQRMDEVSDSLMAQFWCVVPRARAPPIELHCAHADPSDTERSRREEALVHRAVSPATDIYRVPWVRGQLNFPDKRLLQYDCGKLQTLEKLLRKLKVGGHRVLIFTQMTRMLDILEAFLNICGYNYLRLDGATKVEERQKLMERFNNSTKIFCFILSTRSGGVGVNLTGALSFAVERRDSINLRPSAMGICVCCVC